MLTIEVEGIDGLLKDLKGYEKEAQKAIKAGVDKTALAIESDAKERLKGKFGSRKHIITGRLRASVIAKLISGKSFSYSDDKGNNFDGTLVENPGELESLVGTNVEYAAKIEHEYDSFLNWAAVNQQNNLSKRVETELNKIK